MYNRKNKTDAYASLAVHQSLPEQEEQDGRLFICNLLH
ncbi:hypothetical protein ADIAL_0193 [Alkalibacterium sp. AK22]|nr:hypothetical protein ADIAL_0193 [Alkalibacterium sp. AK22]